MSKDTHVVTRREVAQGAKVTAAAQVTTQVCRLLTNVVLARLLVPEDFGVIAIALVVSMFVDQFMDMGTGSAVIQRPTMTDGLLNAVFRLNVGIGAVLSLAMFAVAAPLSEVLGSSDAAPVMRAMSCMALFGSLGIVHHSLLRRDLHFGSIAQVTALSALVNAVIAITGALIGMGVWALAAGNIASCVAATVLVWHFDQWRPSRTVDYASLRPILHYSLNLFASNLLYFCFSQSDKVIITRFLGAGPLGVYALAQRTVTYPVQSIGSVVGEVAFPAFSRRQDDDAALRSGYINATRVIGLVTFPAMLGLAALADPAVHVVFGERWAGLAPLVVVLAPTGALLSVTANSSQLLMAKGKTQWSFWWGIVYGIVMISSQLVGVRWGVLGVAGAYCLSTLVLTPFGLALAFHFVGMRLRDYLRAMLPQVIITAIMVALVVVASRLVADQGGGYLLQLTVGVIVGITTYAGLLVTTRPAVLRDAVEALRARSAK